MDIKVNSNEISNDFYANAYDELKVLAQETANELATANKLATDEIDKDLYEADDDYFDDDWYDIPIDVCDDEHVESLAKDTINKIDTNNKDNNSDNRQEIAR